MCGIAGIIGSKDAANFLSGALDVMKTRGYDGFGIGIQGNPIIKVGPKNLALLQQELKNYGRSGTTGIAHNRWATKGVANTPNAHPHRSGDITVVHNGDLDNYLELRADLENKGYVFFSNTDTEVFAVLVHHYRKELSFFDAVEKAILDLTPTSRFAFLVMDNTTPDTIVVACRGSNPILWSYDEKNKIVYLASQSDVLNKYVSSYSEVAAGHIMQFGKNGVENNKSFSGEFAEVIARQIDTSHPIIAKQYEYWMYQEMIGAPETIRNAISHRANLEQGVVLGGIEDPVTQEQLSRVNRFIVAGCGTSYHAAQIIAMAIEEIAGVSTQAIIASEFIYRTTVFDPETTAMICVSQSGETGDLARLMMEWKSRNMLMLGIVNVPDTKIARLAGKGVYCNIGAEYAVASTKAFLGQVICGILLSLRIGQQRGLSVADRNEYISALLDLPGQAEKVFTQHEYIKSLAEKYASSKNFLYIGRKYNAIVAAEGALKLKEVSYIHAEAAPAGEMKHGTLALIDEHFPTLAVMPHDSVFTATMGNVEEIHSRKGPVIIITDKKLDTHVTDEIIYIPKTIELFSPILSVIPTQMFAYYAALALGHDPDEPRNLAKAVTVE